MPRTKRKELHGAYGHRDGLFCRIAVVLVTHDLKVDGEWERKGGKGGPAFFPVGEIFNNLSPFPRTGTPSCPPRSPPREGLPPPAGWGGGWGVGGGRWGRLFTLMVTVPVAVAYSS